MTASRVVCIGDVMVDVLARLPHALAIGSDTPAPISFLGGGSAANTAAWLVAAGAPTTFVGRVGDDVLGRMALDELGKAGIDLAVGVDPERATGTCIVLVDSAGERTMVPSSGANDTLGAIPLPAGLITAETAVHVSGYTLFRPGSRAAAEEAAALARAHGCQFSADAASSAPLLEFGADRFFEWLAGAGPDSLLFANLDEAFVLVDDMSQPAEELTRSVALRCGQAVVKCGRDGAYWSDGRSVVHAAAEAVGDTALDSTGAGDAFAAGMLASLLRGETVPVALAAANALAREAIGRQGARPPV